MVSKANPPKKIFVAKLKQNLSLKLAWAYA